MARQHGAQIVLTDRTARIGLDRETPQRLGITPDLDLVPRERAQGEDPYRGGHGRAPYVQGAHDARLRRVRDGAERSPEQQRPPETGDVTVTIVGELMSRVDQAAHRAEDDPVVDPGGEPGRPPA